VREQASVRARVSKFAEVRGVASSGSGAINPCTCCDSRHTATALTAVLMLQEPIYEIGGEGLPPKS
jgi:hypothetical protein